jgi:hypothetical protein
MDAGLSAALRRAMYDWLDALERLAATSDAASLAELAQTRMIRLCRAWRDLLWLHEPDEDGRCRTCSKGRRNRANRCAVWVTAHRLLITANADRPC